MKNREEFTRRKSDTSTLKEAINSMMESYKIKGRYEENRLMGSWGTLMGAPIAKRTEKLFVKNKVLYVKLNSAPLRQELTIAKVKVLEIIRRHFDKELIDDVKFY
jgi:predicted nucleic acid-binding Zn ribbon protein